MHSERIDSDVQAEIERALSLPADERFDALEDLRRQLQEHATNVAGIKSDAARKLRREGASIGEVARVLGVSRTRAVQILKLPYSTQEDTEPAQ